MRSLVAAGMVMVLAMAAGAALAGDKNPGPDIVIGTAGDDVLRGGNGPDLIRGLGGNDSIWGNKAPDVLRGGPGNDSIHGFGSGNAPDTLIGGPGKDRCIGTKGDTFRGCEFIKVRKGLG